MPIVGGEFAPNPVREALIACKGYFIHAALFSAIINMLYLAPTIYMLQVYDRVLPTRGSATLVALSLALCAAVAVISCLDFVRSRLLIRTSLAIEDRLSERILGELAVRSAGSSYAVTSAILRQFDTLRNALTGSVALSIFDAPWAPIYVVCCFLLHPALGALSLVGCVLLTGLAWANERATTRLTKSSGSGARVAYEDLDQFLARGSVFGPLGMRKSLVNRHIAARSVASRLSIDASLAATGYVVAIKAARLLLQSLALGLGAYLVINQSMSPGAIFAASLLMARALAPLELFASAWRSFTLAHAGYVALINFFKRQSEQCSRVRLPEPAGRLACENVAVRSDNGVTLLLKGISLSLDPGETLGIVGASGAGKSTLARALVGGLPLAAGSVRIDGAKLADWPEAQLGTMFGYAPQHPSLHQGSIRDNIARFRQDLPPDVLDAEVVRVANLCGAHQMILHLPDGYETQIGWGESGLSVGQAQRIALARAFFGRPAIMVLDEPNASLDSESERRLIQALDQLRREKVTTIVIAHHGEILAKADRILVMKNGEVGLCGPRDTVLSHLRGPSATRPVAHVG